MESYRAGHLTPVFFGSAYNNFGVQRAARRAGRLGAAAAPAAGRAAADRADRAQGRGLRLQGPGQHGPQPSRPRRLPAPVQRQVPPRHEADADGHRQGPVGQLADPVLRPRARDRRRGVAGRHHRHPQPRRAAGRRHADRGRDGQDHRHPQLRAGNPAPRAARGPDEVQAAQARARRSRGGGRDPGVPPRDRRRQHRRRGRASCSSTC